MGFPTRFVRSFLGPLFRDINPPENSETDIGARTFNTAFWQLAGMNLVSPRASLVAAYNAGTGQFAISHQHEAWNAENAQPHPTLTRQSAGRYRYTFAASYQDEADTAIATALSAVRVTSHRILTAYADRIEAFAWIDPAQPLIVEIALYHPGGAGDDFPFWLEVL